MVGLQQISGSTTEYIPLQDTTKPLPRAPTWQRQWLTWRRRKGFTGWRYGVWLATITTISVLVVNVILALYAAVKFGTTDGIGTAFEGRCDAVSRQATWLHVLINIIGSLLLTASNYCMQCLAAPTREECDQAHKRGDWLDIGVLSVRNIFKLHRGRIVLWFILVLSTVPIHLLYNSTVFKAVTTNYYNALVVDEGFVRGQPLLLKQYTQYDKNHANWHPQPYFDLQESLATNRSSWKQLSTADCISTYATDFVQDYNNVLLVKQSDNMTIGTAFSDVMGPEPSALDISLRGQKPAFFWLCTSMNVIDCTRARLLSSGSDYSWHEHKIAYCLVEQPPPHCQLQFSIILLAVVIACNVLKAAVMLGLLYWQSTPTLVVLGDAVASFLDRPSGDSAPLSKEDVQRRTRSYDPTQKPHRWCRAASPGQWTFFALLCCACLGTTSILLFVAASSATSFQQGGQTAFNLGFGAISASTIISSLFKGQDNNKATVSAILLGNFPQLVMSSAYLLLNALFTVMLLCHEWSGYAVKPRPLRVTWPSGLQKSTYWLTLPLGYSIPLVIISATMHWLISQSLFLVRMQTRIAGYIADTWINSTIGSFPPSSSSAGFRKNPNAVLGDQIIFFPNRTRSEAFYRDDLFRSSSALGYSTTPILCCLIVGATLFITTLGFGFSRRFQSNMPVASSCSRAIAAACHPPDKDGLCARSAVQWGEIGDDKDEKQYTFTTLAVRSAAVARPRRKWTIFRWKHRATDPASEPLHVEA